VQVIPHDDQEPGFFKSLAEFETRRLPSAVVLLSVVAQGIRSPPI